MSFPKFCSFWMLIGLITVSDGLPTNKEGVESLNPDLPDLTPMTDPNPWFTNAQDQLKEKLNKNSRHVNRAKNIILFLGDGMSIATITAARIYRGQKKGMLGEEASLVFDEFPHTAMSKVYCLDKSVPDSACTATAYLGGVKSNYETLGVTGAVKLRDCNASLDTNTHIQSIATWAQGAGMNTGFVTTTRVTHASPGGLFGHSAHRDWESDQMIYNDGIDPTECEDLASQLVKRNVGMNFKVILGGGRKHFLPNTTMDPDGLPGLRRDGVDLIDLWKNMKSARGVRAAYVSNKKQMLEASDTADYMLGLFSSSHMPFYLDSDHEKLPRLAEMTSVAMDLVSRNDQRYFLFIEGGRIDSAHHENYANRALDETYEFAEAIKLAVEKADNETLIVVTSDHGHTMFFTGNGKRGDDILSTKHNAKDSITYTSLSYANGPGYRGLVNGSRLAIYPEDTHDARYKYSASVPLSDETHGGEDVLVFARGPWSHLFSGTFEQNYIPHAMAYAACIGPGLHACIRKN